MTFLHKLARRLARLKAQTLIAVAAVSAAAVVLACETPVSLPDSQPAQPISVQVVSGDLQSAPVGAGLPDPLVVKVLDAAGQTRAGQLVNFRVTSGGGSVFAGASLTSASGIAQERWILGTKAAASQRVEARAVDNVTGEALTFAVFTATALPGPPAQLAVKAGDRDTAAAGTAVAKPPSVIVRDRYGNPVPGIPVSFAVASGGGSITAASDTTDAGGIATVGSWTLGSTPGTNTLSATVSGLPAATFTAIASLPAVASVTVSPAAPGVTVGQAVQLTATLQDASGNVLTGRTVTWASGSSGVATVSGGGLVTGVAAGSAVVTATREGKSGTATITVTAPGGGTTPGAVTNLVVAGTTNNAVTLSFTEVSDGTGQPASYDLRAAVGTMSWGDTPSVSRGTCATPVVGTAVGAKRTCTVLGLAAATGYQFQLVAFRGTLNQGAVFGGLSNVATGTTAASTAPVASVSVSPAAASVTVGQTAQLTATLKDANGNVVTGRTITWATSATGVATVAATGLVLGAALGSATITATSEGKNGSAAIAVAATVAPGAKVESFCPGGSNPVPSVILCESFENPLSGWNDEAGNSRECSAGYNSTCSYDSGILNFDGSWGYSGRYGGHKLTDAPREHDELYVRYYYRPYANGDILGYPDDDQGEKGVYLMNSLGESLVENVKAQFCRYPQRPYTTCRAAMSTYADSREDFVQNQGNDLYVTPGNWYFVKYYIKLNHPGVADGIFKMWADPAPASSSPTLRLSYTNVYIRGSGNTHGYDYLWLSTYAQRCNSNCPASLNKHMRIDQIVVSTADIPAFER